MPGTKTPQVTVITSTYNWPDALHEAIHTVLSQTFTDFEYLVIGDCCTDNTAEMIQEFDDPRIRWHNLPTNTGNQSGVNKVALEMARGEYIAYLNHDDLWFPHHLEALLEPLKTQGLDIVSSIALDIKPHGHNFRELIGLPKLDKQKRLATYPMTSNVMHTRQAASEAGGWIDWRDTHEIPTQDFFRRLRELRHNYAVLNDITSLKFHSAERKNSYLTKNASEQAHYRKVMASDPEFRYRETMKAIAYRRLKIKNPHAPVPKPPQQAPKGWLIEQWRLNRGLTPMLESETKFIAQALPAAEDSWVKIQPDDSTLIVNLPDTAQASPRHEFGSLLRTLINKFMRIIFRSDPG